MKKSTQSKIAVSLPGGGSKGAWLAGWWKAAFELRPELKNRVCIVYGTSTGSLNTALVGAYLATGDSKYLLELVKIYQSVTDVDVLTPMHALAYKIGGEVGGLVASALTKEEAIFSVKPLEELIDRFMTPSVWRCLISAGQRRNNPVEIGFTAVSMQTGKARVFSNITDPDPAILRKALIASASEPVFMPLVEIDGEQWTDGGVTEYTPVEKLFESSLFKSQNVDTIIAQTLGGWNPTIAGKMGDVIDILLRTVDLLTSGVYNSDIQGALLYNTILKVKEFMTPQQWSDFVDQLPEDIQHIVKNELKDKRYVRLLVAGPSQTITMNGLSFKQPAMRNLSRRGFRDGTATITKIFPK